MTEHLKVCFDRVLPKDLFRPHLMAPGGGPGAARAVLPDFRKLWINGSTLRVRFMGGTAQEQQIAREQAGWWTEHANLRFDFNNALDAEIRVAFDPNDGAWSYIGTDCKDIPQNEPTMNLGFLDGGTAAHEFGHAIGLGHNVLEKYSGDHVRGTEFDPDSIMLYFFPDSWVIGGHGTKENNVLSAIDKAFIASAQAYPRTDVTVTD